MSNGKGNNFFTLKCFTTMNESLELDLYGFNVTKEDLKQTMYFHFLYMRKSENLTITEKERLDNYKDMYPQYIPFFEKENLNN